MFAHAAPPGLLEIDHFQLRHPYAQALGDHAPVAARRVRLEAHERGARAIELARERIELARGMRLHVLAVGGGGLLRAARAVEPADLERRAELAPVLVGDAVL